MRANEDDAARGMLKEIVVRQVQHGSDEWLKILARRRPEAAEYIAMRPAEMIAAWQRER
jgi:hypothetical protein